MTGHRPEELNAIEKAQIEQSDVITFHVYDWPEVFERRVKQLQAYGRPLICTEYLARGAGSTFDTSLPLARKYDVGMMNWGFVLGEDADPLPRGIPGSVPIHRDTRRPCGITTSCIRDGKPYRQARGRADSHAHG